MKGQGPTIRLQRLCILIVLVAGFMAAQTGAALAVSGISSSGSAGAAQYPTTVPPGNTPTLTTGEGDTGGDGGSGAPGGGETLGEGGGEAPGTAGTVRSESQPDDEDAQVQRQIASAGSDKLPFTGLAALPLLLAGGGLAAAGFVLRRSAARRQPR